MILMNSTNGFGFEPFSTIVANYRDNLSNDGVEIPNDVTTDWLNDKLSIINELERLLTGTETKKKKAVQRSPTPEIDPTNEDDCYELRRENTFLKQSNERQMGLS
ncbi:hypothetical protein CEXT_776051 [Caerostris extrusa]|uniref:Uncharacterized protein n=1 Tax=Caerostris extrusa TaxID=172846 RepID=A0AAV4TI34_CAEEX|nr:hypothetical protein CEXT_776051 [Caerostris extrusa]